VLLWTLRNWRGAETAAAKGLGAGVSEAKGTKTSRRGVLLRLKTRADDSLQHPWMKKRLGINIAYSTHG